MPLCTTEICSKPVLLAVDKYFIYIWQSDRKLYTGMRNNKDDTLKK
jgi:hypothetical protein